MTQTMLFTMEPKSLCDFPPCSEQVESMLLLSERPVAGFCSIHAESFTIWCRATWGSKDWRFEQV